MQDRPVPFSQGALLARVRSLDPAVRRGVCVALCAHWLRDITRDGCNVGPPEPRLQKLADRFPEICRDQKSYGERRGQAGREVALVEAGRKHGLAFEPQTTVMRACLDPQQIRRKLASDLACRGAAATWSIRFDGGRSGHAIAGFHGFVRRAENYHCPTVRVFDPNFGEYPGAPEELDRILVAVLRSYPDISEIHRTSEGEERWLST